MSNSKAPQELRPFSLTEENFNALEQSLLTLTMLEDMASELNPSIGAIQADQVCAFISMVTDKLGPAIESARESFSSQAK